MEVNKDVNKAGDLENLSVKCLKTYLWDRGAHVSGNKAELLKRAKGVADLGIWTLREIHAQDSKNEEVQTFEKLKTPFGEKLPDPNQLRDNWTCNVEDIPHFSENDLYNYLVLNRRRTFDSESMKAKRQLKVCVFYEDWHVHSIKFHPILEDCTHGFVKCKVIPSLPTLTETKKPDYDVWICLSKETRNVHSAGCTCSAGEGESCNHVAALLYALVDVSSKMKDGFHAPTSDACKWNKPKTRKLSPKKSLDLTFKKLKFSTECSLERKSQAKSSINISPAMPIEPVDVMEFSNKLKVVNPYAAFLQSTGDYVKAPYPKHETPKLHNIVSNNINTHSFPMELFHNKIGLNYLGQCKYLYFRLHVENQWKVVVLGKLSL